LLNIAEQGSLIMVESSVYVGATREIFGIFRNKGVYVGFSPERVDPGRIEPPMEKIPKIIAGLDNISLQICKEIYQSVFEKIIPVSTTETAEMCKLYENCFRMVNIAYVNEISDLCDQNNIDINEVVNASASKPFGFMPFKPGIGVGGHCIPVNPYYLFKSGNSPVLKYATELMEQRPQKKAIEIIQKYNPNNILITGVGFKKGESLLTNSPGYDLYNELKSLDKNVQVYDPIVQKYNNSISFLNKDQFTSENLLKFDLVIINLPLNENEQEIQFN
jgi:nucleotide sugar dehydrogenase